MNFDTPIAILVMFSYLFIGYLPYKFFIKNKPETFSLRFIFLLGISGSIFYLFMIFFSLFGGVILISKLLFWIGIISLILFMISSKSLLKFKPNLLNLKNYNIYVIFPTLLLLKWFIFLLLKPIIDPDVIEYYIPLAKSIYINGKLNLFNYLNYTYTIFPPIGGSMNFLWVFSIFNNISIDYFKFIPILYLIGLLFLVFNISKYIFNINFAYKVLAIYSIFPILDFILFERSYYPDIISSFFILLFSFILIGIYKNELVLTNLVSIFCGFFLAIILLMKIQDLFFYGIFVLLLFYFFKKHKQIRKQISIILFFSLIGLVFFIRNFYMFDTPFFPWEIDNANRDIAEIILEKSGVFKIETNYFTNFAIFLLPGFLSSAFLFKLFGIFSYESYKNKVYTTMFIISLMYYVFWIFILGGSTIRYLLPILPIFSLAIMNGIDKLSKRSQIKPLILIIILTLFSLVQSNLLYLNFKNNILDNIYRVISSRDINIISMDFYTIVTYQFIILTTIFFIFILLLKTNKLIPKNRFILPLTIITFIGIYSLIYYNAIEINSRDNNYKENLFVFYNHDMLENAVIPVLKDNIKNDKNITIVFFGSVDGVGHLMNTNSLDLSKADSLSILIEKATLDKQQFCKFLKEDINVKYLIFSNRQEYKIWLFDISRTLPFFTLDYGLEKVDINGNPYWDVYELTC